MAPETHSVGQDLWLVAQLAWHLGYIIAVPAAVFGFAGASLDKALGTSPLFILLGFTLAVVLSAVGVYRKVKKILCSS